MTSLHDSPLPLLLHQKWSVALRTLLGNGFVPQGKGAFWIIGAAIEGSSLSGPSFNQHSVTSLLGTTDAGIERLGKLAGGIVGAGQKPPELAILDHHRASAFFTLHIGLHFLRFAVFLHLSGITAFGVTRTG